MSDIDSGLDMLQGQATGKVLAWIRSEGRLAEC